MSESIIPTAATEAVMQRLAFALRRGGSEAVTEELARLSARQRTAVTLLLLGRVAGRTVPTEPWKRPDFTPRDRLKHHSAYLRGKRDPLTIDGERAYQRHAKQRRRRSA